jgi:hypothetical protein
VFVDARAFVSACDFDSHSVQHRLPTSSQIDRTRGERSLAGATQDRTARLGWVEGSCTVYFYTRQLGGQQESQ